MVYIEKIKIFSRVAERTQNSNHVSCTRIDSNYGPAEIKEMIRVKKKQNMTPTYAVLAIRGEHVSVGTHAPVAAGHVVTPERAIVSIFTALVKVLTFPCATRRQKMLKIDGFLRQYCYSLQV